MRIRRTHVFDPSWLHIVDYGNSLRVYNVGVLMASHLDSPFDLERCGPAVDLALAEVNDFLSVHNVQLRKVQGRYNNISNSCYCCEVKKKARSSFYTLYQSINRETTTADTITKSGHWNQFNTIAAFDCYSKTMKICIRIKKWTKELAPS